MDLFIRALNPFLMIAMPLALGSFLARRWKLDWRLFGVGVLTFIASQVLHIPFNIWLLSPTLQRLGLTDVGQPLRLLAIALLLGLSAGVFEESARYLVYRRWLKGDRTWRRALMFGAGHGGIESILVSILALIALWQATALRDADLTNLVPPERIAAVQASLAAYWGMPWHQVLLGAVERAAALCIHLGLTVLVLQALSRRRLVWLAAAIGWHTLVNTLTVFAVQTWGIYITEALIVLSGLASLGLALALRTPEPAPVPPPPVPPIPIELIPADPTPEQLEASRYD